MKRIYFLLAAALLAAPSALRGQDAAVEERLNKLSAQIQDLVEARDAQNKRIEELAKQVMELQDQQSKPTASYASPEDLKELAGKLQEVDRKRVEDTELILKKIEGLGKTLGASTPRKPVAIQPATPSGDGSAPGKPEDGYYYVIQSGDSLSAIAKAYGEKNIKVTVTQIQKANPGLNPEKMRVGQKIFIPAAQ